MSVTLRDCLKLPSLSLGKVIAGHKGLSSIVTTVSVLEFEDGMEEDIMTPNELLVSALFCLKDDVDAQCQFLRKCKHNGDVGLVLFYADMILGNIDAKLLETADLLNFPIILLPGKDMGLKYSDVIGDVMEAIFYDRKVNHYFVSSTIERLSQTPEAVRTPSLALQIASDYAKASFFLCDRQYHLIASSFWPASNYLNFEIVKEAFSDDPFTDHTVVKNQEDGVFFRTPFVEKDDSTLILYAASKNEILYSGIMSEVVEIIQLFTALWHYNLNVSTKEAVIPALFDGKQHLVRHICQLTHLKAELYNEAMIAEVRDFTPEKEIQSFLAEVRLLFAKSSIPLIADLHGTHVILLYQNEMAVKNKLLEEDLKEILNERSFIPFYTYYHTETLFEELGKFLREYSKVKNTARGIYPHKKCFTAEDMRYALRILDLHNSVSAEKEYYCNLLRPVLDDKDIDLMLTLSAYLLDAASELKKASEILFVHRNTVLYRLNKIKSLLGFDLAKMPMAYDIYVAVSLYRINEQNA
ncbi:MAG: PucR family transcriptional regulator [Emergencia timonensis]